MSDRLTTSPSAANTTTTAAAAGYCCYLPTPAYLHHTHFLLLVPLQITRTYLMYMHTTASSTVPTYISIPTRLLLLLLLVLVRRQGRD